jgi:hypothetical protein
MAFVKYNRDVNINAMMAALQGLDIMGRKLRIELKRTPAQQPQTPTQPQQLASYEEGYDKASPQRINGRVGQPVFLSPRCALSHFLSLFFVFWRSLAEGPWSGGAERRTLWSSPSGATAAATAAPRPRPGNHLARGKPTLILSHECSAPSHGLHSSRGIGRFCTDHSSFSLSSGLPEV